MDHSYTIKFYEYLAKNVGLRYALSRFQWILVTNPDVVFSPQLYDALKRRGFYKRGLYYRMDRFNYLPSFLNPWTISNYTVFNQTDSYDYLWPPGFPNREKFPRMYDAIVERIVSVDGEAKHGFCKRMGIQMKIDPLTLGVYNMKLPDNNEIASLNVMDGMFTTDGSWVGDTIDRNLRVNFTLCKASVNVLFARNVTFIDDTVAATHKDKPMRITECEQLHTMAPGDFLLAEASEWKAIGGFPEYQTSGHTDSVMIALMGARKLKQVVLAPPFRLFHCEHDRREQFSRPSTDWMQMLNECKRLFRDGGVAHSNNKPNWGLRGETLPTWYSESKKNKKHSDTDDDDDEDDDDELDNGEDDGEEEEDNGKEDL